VAEIVVGATFKLTVTVEPANVGQTNADVTTALTGASVTALVKDPAGTTLLTLTGSVLSASDRTVLLTATAAQTAGLTPQIARWHATYTTTGAEVYPISVHGRPRILAIAGD
jgi:hypothetical protein